MTEKDLCSWEPWEDGLKLTACETEAQSLTLPESVQGKPVRCIGEGAFSGSMLTELILPDSVRRIENHAFENCFVLSRIRIAPGLTDFDGGSIETCAVERLVLPASLKRLRHSLRMSCPVTVEPGGERFFCDGVGIYEKTEQGLKLLYISPGQEDPEKAGGGAAAAPASAYTLLNGTSEMAPGVLRVSTLRHFIFPPSLKSIPEGEFFRLGNAGQPLSASAPGSPWLFVDSGCLYLRSRPGLSSELTLLWSMEDRPVLRVCQGTTVIAADAFAGRNIPEIILPASVTEIHRDAFTECAMESLKLEGSGQEILFPPEKQIRQRLLTQLDGRTLRYRYGILMEILTREYISTSRLAFLIRYLKADILPSAERQTLRKRAGEKFVSLLPALVQERNTALLEQVLDLDLLSAPQLQEAFSVLESLSPEPVIKEMVTSMGIYRRRRFGGGQAALAALYL